MTTEEAYEFLLELLDGGQAIRDQTEPDNQDVYYQAYRAGYADGLDQALKTATHHRHFFNELRDAPEVAPVGDYND